MASEKQIQEVLVEGATEGLAGPPLSNFVREKLSDAEKKRLRCSFFTLSEPEITDRNILNVLYDLALALRLDSDHDDAPEPVRSKDKAEWQRPAKKRGKNRSVVDLARLCPIGSSSTTATRRPAIRSRGTPSGLDD